VDYKTIGAKNALSAELEFTPEISLNRGHDGGSSAV
jgi:hypothetical protein